MPGSIPQHSLEVLLTIRRKAESAEQFGNVQRNVITRAEQGEKLLCDIFHLRLTVCRSQPPGGKNESTGRQRSAGVIGGAGLDVYETEPLPSDHPLRLAPNTLLTSHTAWYSAGSVPVLQRKSAEAVLAGLRGGPLANVVNQRFFPATP